MPDAPATPRSSPSTATRSRGWRCTSDGTSHDVGLTGRRGVAETHRAVRKLRRRRAAPGRTGHLLRRGGVLENRWQPRSALGGVALGCVALVLMLATGASAAGR